MFGDYIGKIEVFIIVISCIGVFVSRQSAFYYQVCFSVCVFMRFILRMSFRSGRPFMNNPQVDPYICQMSYGTPDCAVMELVAMVFVIMKNPKSLIQVKD
jgi:hypothetical protein